MCSTQQHCQGVRWGSSPASQPSNHLEEFCINQKTNTSAISWGAKVFWSSFFQSQLPHTFKSIQTKSQAHGPFPSQSQGAGDISAQWSMANRTLFGKSLIISLSLVYCLSFPKWFWVPYFCCYPWQWSECTVRGLLFIRYFKQRSLMQS